MSLHVTGGILPSHRTQSFQALKDRLNNEVLTKERELRDLIDSAVEVSN